MKPETWLAHAGSEADPITGSVVPPVVAATTFRRDDQYRLPGPYVYARYGHPLVDRAQEVLAELDGGGEALVFNSGLSAMNAVLGVLPSGAGVAIPRVMYHGGRDLVFRAADRSEVDVREFDATDPESLEQVVADHGVDLVWVETLSNPMWDVTDVAAMARVASGAGARLVVDSTVTPPVTFRPLAHGADLVFHSATKYLNGHSDVTAGVLAGRETDSIWPELAEVRKLQGTVLPPLESWLLLRGLRTLHLRFERAAANARAVAEHLEAHSGIERVLYPGLPSHPGHHLASRQLTAGSAMLSALVIGGADEALRVATRLNVIKPATSLGGVESLVEHRATVEGPDSPVPDNLLRFSIGIEAVEDLIEDLDQALEA